MMQTVEALIDECVKLCKGQNQTARAIGITRGHMSTLVSGKRGVSPEVLARLARLADLDGETSRRLLAELEIQKATSEESREVMRRAFFTSLAVGAVLAATVNETDEGMPYFTVYTLCTVCWVLRRITRTALPAVRALCRRRVYAGASFATG